MKIHFVSHAENTLASHRMRVIKPVELLKVRGHDATYSNVADANADVNVFQKHMNMGYDESMASLLKGRTKIAFDISDDHFDKKAAEHYSAMIDEADIITCNGPTLIERTKKLAGLKQIHYVKDPITFPEYDVRTTLNLKEPKLVWYGHITNFTTMSAVIPTLVDPLTVITNKEVEGSFTFLPWDVGVVEKEIKNYDIVLLPLQKDVSKHTKNTNRAVDALQAGRFVVTDSAEVYGDLKDYIYIGDISEGVKWAKANPEEAIRKVVAGQEVVRELYNDRVIADMWEIALCGTITRKLVRETY